MPNAWDGASAALLADAGFEALGSSSAAIAWGLGVRDGRQQVSRDAAIANAALLGRSSGLPVNGDLEDGFGPDPDDCALTVEMAVSAGLAGLGIEDTTAEPDRPIHDFDQAVRRVRRAAEAARGRILLTGRTDIWLHGQGDLDETIRRLTAFAEAGADLLFAPGLPDLDSIRAVVAAVAPRPVNVVMGPASGLVPLSELDQAGVRRVSLGASLYRHALGDLAARVTRIRDGDLACVGNALGGTRIEALLDARH